MGEAGRRGFGFWTLTFLVVANMVGAGVFTTSGFTLASLENPWVVLAAWLVAGGIAVCGALSYGMLVARRPVSGGEFAFLTEAGFPFVGFVAGWVSLLAGFSGAIAYAALALESHLPGDFPEKGPAVAAVVVGAVLHGARRVVGAGAQNVAVFLKLLLLAGILVWSARSLSTLEWQGVAGMPRTGPTGILAFGQALVWISLSYSGFNAAVYVAGESESIQSVKRSLWTGTGLVVVLYLLLNAVFVLAPPAGVIVGRADVAALAAGWIGGESFGLFVRLVISLALLTSVWSMMMAGPRVYGKMAEGGLLPKIFVVRPDRVGPAVFLQMGIALVLIFAANLQDLLGYLGLTLSLCAAAAVLSLFAGGPTARVHGWQVVPPLLYVGATVVSAILLVWQDPWQAVGLGVTLGLGAVGFVLRPRALRLS